MAKSLWTALAFAAAAVLVLGGGRGDAPSFYGEPIPPMFDQVQGIQENRGIQGNQNIPTHRNMFTRKLMAESGPLHYPINETEKQTLERQVKSGIRGPTEAKSIETLENGLHLYPEQVKSMDKEFQDLATTVELKSLASSFKSHLNDLAEFGNENGMKTLTKNVKKILRSGDIQYLLKRAINVGREHYAVKKELEALRKKKELEGKQTKGENSSGGENVQEEHASPPQ